MKMHVAELWRYPVKSLAGEPLDAAEISADGIPGDRVIQVYDAEGRIVTSRTTPRLLGLKGTLSLMGETLVNGRPWTAPEVGAAIEAAAGPGARLVRHDGPDRFDVLPLLVATDGAVEALGFDRRRFRPNILIAGVNGLAEREWPGRQARVGEAIISFKKLRGRCVMTTYDPDTLEQDPTVLRRIVQEMGGRLALDTYVVRGGRVAVGDPVELL
ncbi:MAG: MOSC N-terminal beta barrel domain-containing protein [Candidatus Rokubacteria bacterium]|nr:MOSC N-terminal beta barrel domain-containing protein [Candidatus Rokubacteria bacterium]